MPDVSTAPLHDLMTDLAVINRPADPATWSGIYAAQQQAHDELNRWQNANDDVAAGGTTDMRPGTLVLGLAEAQDCVDLATLARDFAETTALRVRFLLHQASVRGIRIDRAHSIAEDTRAILTKLLDTVTDRTSGYTAGPTLRTARAALGPLLDREAALSPLTSAGGRHDPAAAISAWCQRLDDTRFALGAHHLAYGDLPVDEVHAWLRENRNPHHTITRGLIAAQAGLPGPLVARALEQLAGHGTVAHGPGSGWTLLTS